MTDLRHYPVDVFYSDDDEGYIALAPDLPGCSAFGETRAEAVDQLQDAICAWIEASGKAGNPIPEPSKRGEEPLPSGRILLRLPRTLHGQLVEQAQREGTSLNQFLLYVITSNTSAQLVATAVADKLMTASSARSTVMASLASNALTAVAAANTRAQYNATVAAGRMIVGGIATTDVVAYGKTSRSLGIASFREKSFDPFIVVE